VRLFLLIILLLQLRAAAADFCAAYVKVARSDGKPVEAPIALIDADGNVESSTIAHQGRASICDIGFGPHTIRIGKIECGGYVTIHNVSLVYGFPQNFSAVWDGCRNIDLMTIPPSCSVAFRVTSADGKKLGNADAAIEGDETTYHADTYGRFFLSVGNGSAKDFTFSAPGYADQRANITCKRYENIEKLIQMIPK
jgi:hypothetical protein